MKNFLQSACIALTLFSSTAVTAQVPLLNSNPSASAVVFLDFDGQTVNGTSWNVSGPIYCGASGLDNTQITTVFDRVSEDYRPFNINITTDSTKYFAAPINKRMRVILTVTWQWYGSAGGVAFVGSFAWGDNTPCFIFTSLLNYNVKNVSEAAAHEAGHTLGLFHQSSYDVNCVKISDYNYGQGTGEIGWAPIMGAGYYQNLTLWNNGPNSFGCNNLQSDLSVITTNNGFTYRTDDHAASFAGATSVGFSGNQFTVNGIIEQNSDQDMIKFIQPSLGRFQLNAVPYNVGAGNAGSDLDLQVTLFNGSQTQINMYNPGTLLSSVIDTVLDAGTYYLRIEGKGNVYAPNYASLGSYALNGTFTAGNPLPLRRLELYGELNGDRHILNWIIDADEQVTEQILEVSTDGRTFSPVSQVPNNDRTYNYRPAISNAAQYRLNVTFDNGKQYYSNIVTLRNTGNTPRPRVINNLVNGNNISVSSPGVYTYTINDFTGKIIARGQLTNGINTISSNALSGGMYVVRFTNGSEQWSDKIVRQ
jgi:hypothetical protein